ncbi:hypothetical protein [Catellatospora chokoriensis]|nr:hypothetical protein [Catellatospora chokoriensis]
MMLAGAALGLTGCSASAEPAVPSSSSTATDARAAFHAATSALTAQPFGFEVELQDKLTLSGQFDPVTRKGSVSGQIPINGKLDDFEFITLGDDVWLRLGGATAGSAWMHAPADRLTESSFNLANPANPNGVMYTARAVQTLWREGTNTFGGEVDLTGSWTGPSIVGPTGTWNTSRGMPFNARFDASGRFDQFAIDLNTVLPGAFLVTRYRYGVTVQTQAPPAAEVVEMPERLLQPTTA